MCLTLFFSYMDYTLGFIWIYTTCLISYLLDGPCRRPATPQWYSQLPKSWRNPKNLEISLGEGFWGSRGDVAFSLCLG